MEFDGKTRNEILKLRTAAVMKHPLLVKEGYIPCNAVFNLIADRRPWWGIRGHFVHGPGTNSIEGDSEESRFIMNPYLLVAADFLGISIWNQAFKWDAAKVSKATLNDAKFPFYCRPVSLTWWPAESRAEAKYELGKYVADVNKYAETGVENDWMLFDITAYNARDMNLNFLYFSPEESEGVSQGQHEKRAVPVLHYLHLGGSCQYPGGGNNCSPYQEEMDGFRVEKLPARAVFLLWRNEPANVTGTPDMRFTLVFE
jgi:hypothetical protein